MGTVLVNIHNINYMCSELGKLKLADNLDLNILESTYTNTVHSKLYPSFLAMTIPNNGVSYGFYDGRDILTPSDDVFQAKAYRSGRKYLL